ncbi:unnamed protein product [Rhodiola kirilowii]
MDLREGQNITRPPLLEGNKYGYWRVRMKAFLKSQDESVWEAFEQGWTHPVTADKEGNIGLLAKDKWTEIHKSAEAANSKAMNAIFSGVDGKNFKMISTCEVAKKAWDILRTAHEGTTKVKISRIEMVTSKFENLRMQEDETIADFNTRVLDISNESFALGEPMSEETLVRKVLRSLPKRYAMKALAVKDAHDVKTMRLDELMGSLQAHEMEMEMDEEEQHKKVKCVGLQYEVTDVLDKEGEMSEQLYVMLARNFMRRLSNEGSDPGESSNSRIQKEGKFQRKYKSGDYSHDNKCKGIQCKECEGYGHIRVECVNTRKKKNAYAGNWSDSESNQEGESNDFVALASCVNLNKERSKGVTSKLSSDDDTQYSSCSDDEEITNEEFVNNYKELFHQFLIEVERNKNHCSNLVGLKEEAAVLVAQKVEYQQTIIDLKTQLIEIKDERAELVAQKTELLEVVSSLKIQIETSQGEHPEIIDDLKKKNDALCQRKMLNSGTKDLDSILGAQRTSGGYKGLGFTGASSSGKTTFVKAKPRSHVVPAEHLPRRKATWYPSRKQKQNDVRRRDGRICYYCNKRGHIKPRCYEFLAYLRKLKQKPVPQVRQVWRVKQKEEVCLAAYCSTSHLKRGRWFFDSGCSAHMTGDPNFLADIKSFKGQSVTFRNGVKGKVIGKGTLKVQGLPQLESVLLVDGLEANLISISQLCDEDHHIKFTQDTCQVLNKEGECIMQGSRSLNNCYLLEIGQTPPETTWTESIYVTVRDDVDTLLVQGNDEDGAVADPEQQPSLSHVMQEAVLDKSPKLAVEDDVSNGDRPTCHLKVRLFQMDVNNTFRNSLLSEEVYEAQPKGLEDPHHSDHVYQLKTAVYGLKQAPRAWYERMTRFLIDHDYVRGGVETLFVKHTRSDFNVAQIVMDNMVDQLVKRMKSELMISKKQNNISLSTVEAEYIAVGCCCTQMLWKKSMLK